MKKQAQQKSLPCDGAFLWVFTGNCHHLSLFRRIDSVSWPKSHSSSKVGHEPRDGNSGAYVVLFHKYQRDGRENATLVCTG